MPFASCRHCEKVWESRAAFLADAQLVLSGCQVEVERPEASVFLFDHRTAGCGTTLALDVGRFDDMYDGPRHKVKWGLSAKCARHCHDPADLGPCGNPCAADYVRQVLQRVRAARP
jgi:hypothetical protein